MKEETAPPYIHLSLGHPDAALMPLQEVDIRSDIQGIRGWAILAVIISHFFPEAFSHGYLGVDVFFVVTGFLTAEILKNHCRLTHRTYTQFVFMCVRRIFPVLLLVTLVVGIYYKFRFSDVVLYDRARSVIYALTFTTTTETSEPGDELSKTQDLLKHTWAQAIELQFSLFAPLIILTLKMTTGGVNNSFTSCLFLVSIFSFYLLTVSGTDNIFTRLWQFLLGVFVFGLETVLQPGTSVSCHFYKAMWYVLVLGSTFLSICLESAIINRLLVTVVVCGVIYSKTRSSLLTHALIVQLGECSFPLYLLHWPALCILREYSDSDAYAKALTIYFSLILSHLSFKYYEKWYIKLRQHEVFLLIGSLCLANILVLIAPSSHFVREQLSSLFNQNHTKINVPLFYFHDNKDPTESGEAKDAKSIFDAEFINIARTEREKSEILNTLFDERRMRHLLIPNCSLITGGNPFGLCEAPKGVGNLTFLSIGNVCNANHARLIMNQFRNHYSSLHFYSRASCLVLPDNNSTPSNECSDPKAMLRVVEKIKPDILFIMQRFQFLNRPLQGDMVHDDQFKLLYKATEDMAKLTKKIFILDALPALFYNAPRQFYRSGAHFLSDGDVDAAIPIRNRLEKVASSCSNCILFDTFNAHLTKEGFFMAVDPRSSFNIFDSAWNHTPYGLKLIEPVFKMMAQNFTKLLIATSPNNTFNVFSDAV